MIDPKEVNLEKRTCSIEDCDQQIHSRGWCRSHYLRQWRAGRRPVRPIKVARLPRPRGLIPNSKTRIWARIRTGTISECWECNGAPRPSGYKTIRYDSKTQLAHRVIWMITFGPIPAGLFVCHRCDNPPCCNPFHLFLGTGQDNTQDAISKNRFASGERHPAKRDPNWGHHLIQWNKKNSHKGRSKTKLTAADVITIRQQRAAGTYARVLAEQFGVSKCTIDNVVSYKSWTHIA